jgi:hypothetical protein
MADQKTPEAGERCTDKTTEGEQTAIWTGHVWASEDGSRLIDSDPIESWQEAPTGGDLEVKMPDGTMQKVDPQVVGTVEPEQTGESD